MIILGSSLYSCKEKEGLNCKRKFIHLERWIETFRPKSISTYNFMLFNNKKLKMDATANTFTRL